MKKYAVLILIPFIFLSCSDKKTAILWSSNKEAVNIAELYNNSNDEYRIIFQYKENLTASFINAEEKPDILIGKDLQNNEIMSKLLSLDNFYRNGLSDGKDIFASLLDGTLYNDQKHLVPLSFAMSTAVFMKNSKRIDRNYPSIELNQMMSDSVKFNENVTKKGYSPLWDEGFLYAILDLFDSSFVPSPTGSLAWNENRLSAALNFIKEWNESNGGSEEMRLFDSKYMYDNRIKILKEERILFTYMNSTDFMELSDSTNIDLDFLYISNDHTLHPEQIVYGGIYKKTNAYKASYDFLSWMMSNKTQQMIIGKSLQNKSASFGILGGFSSLIAFNDGILSSYYPRLKGKIPEPRYLQSQGKKPAEFDTVKSELIIPWAEEAVHGSLSDLADALEKWEKLRIPY